MTKAARRHSTTIEVSEPVPSEVPVGDQTGAMMARGHLGDAPWPGTSALYWTQMELQAPADAGMWSWSAKFEAGELELPHDGAASQFNIVIVRPPEHRLTVKVID